MVISKDIKFDCAHMLSNYEGKCSNLHGHTYHGTVTLEGDVDPETGMLIDYNDIKRVVDRLDHAVVFSSQDIRNEAENKLQKWAVDYNMKFVVLSGKSTAESMAEHISKLFLSYPNIKSAHVRLSETDGSWAVAEARK